MYEYHFQKVGKESDQSFLKGVPGMSFLKESADNGSLAVARGSVIFRIPTKHHKEKLHENVRRTYRPDDINFEHRLRRKL